MGLVSFGPDASVGPPRGRHERRVKKIAVIEDYISAVHFVHNEGGASSMVQNLTIEEYRERKQEFLTAASA